MKARRHRRGHVNDWDGAFRELRSEKFGTQLALHHITGNITAAQKEAGDHYAEVVRRYDNVFGLRRHTGGFFIEGDLSQDEKVEYHERMGTIDQYERRMKKIKKEMKSADDALVKICAREIVIRVCVDNQSIPPDQHPILKAALECLVRVFGFNAKGERPRKITTWHGPGAKPGSKGNSR
jgi:hypothetical protein